MTTKKTAAIMTLGCRLNQADSALLSDRLRKLGFEIVSTDAPSSPNLIVVNSCAVTAVAAKKSRQALKAIRGENPQSFIVMTGCSADVDYKELNKLDDCDLVLTNEQKKEIEHILPRYLAYLTPDTATGDHKSKDFDPVFREQAETFFPFKSRAILKIQEGCENFCTYCIVPYARGKERSRDLEETVNDFRQLAEAGFGEIVLSGVNICNYNCGGTDLVGLIERLLEIPGNYRIRLSSTEPGPILPELIRCMKRHSDRICAFLHLPLQNGSDEILKAMGRKYTAAEYAGFVEMARKEIPHIHIGTDLIVGFPGETAANFKETCAFLEKIGFANIHVFPFSPRKGTPAENMPGRVTGPELDARLERIREIKAASSKAFVNDMIGQNETVLLESRRHNGVCEGWSGNYIKTRFAGADLPDRSLVKVIMRKVLSDGAVAAEVMKD